MARRLAAIGERGQALFVAILAILIISIMGIAVLFVAQVEYALAAQEVRQSATFYAAESGLEYAAAMLTTMVGENYHGGPAPLNLSTGRGRGDSIEVVIGRPDIVREEHLILNGDNGEQTGIKRTTYKVVSTARATRSQTVVSLEAEIAITPGRETVISEFKEARR